MVPVLSQETTPEPPVPTETPTLTPIPTNTEIPTETMTTSPSPTPTFEPTSTETATLTATITPELMPSLTPTAIQIEPMATMTPSGIIPMNFVNPDMSNLGSRQSSILIPNGDITALRNNVASACGGGSPVTIELTTNGTYTFTDAPYNLFYPTALLICGNVTIIGNNATLQRATNAPFFRLIGVENMRLLTLENVTLRDGYIDANGGAALVLVGGGAVLNNVQILNNDAIDNSNFLTSGAAVYNYFGYLELNNVTIQDSNSSTELGGGAVNSWGGDIVVRNSRFINNTSSQNGGALFIRFSNSMELQYNEIVNNTAINGGAVYVEGFTNSNHFMTKNCIYNNVMSANPSFAVMANQLPALNATYNYWNGPASVNANVNTEPIVWFSPSDCTSQTAWDLVLALPTPTPSPTPPPLTYGIVKLNYGTGIWSTNEETAIDTGVANVAQAFLYLTQPPQMTTLEEAFNEVMLENSQPILFIRTQSAVGTTITIPMGTFAGQTAILSYPSPSPGNCIAYAGSVSTSAAVICNGSLIDHYSGTIFTGEADQYTIVHELGHLFDYRTQDGITNVLIAGGFNILDCDDIRVMGIVGDEPWERGRRGWGTGPQQYLDNGIARPLVTDFQQNTANIAREAGADMFLNWVYRINQLGNGDPATDFCNLENIPLPGHWTGPGFLNQAWSADPHPSFITNSQGIPGTLDTALPGDRRHLRMDQIMRDIFTDNNW